MAVDRQGNVYVRDGANRALRKITPLGAVTTLVPVDAEGRVDPEAIRRAVRPDTFLISVMAANNEVGTLAPLAELSTVARECGVPLHTDAVRLDSPARRTIQSSNPRSSQAALTPQPPGTINVSTATSDDGRVAVSSTRADD